MAESSKEDRPESVNYSKTQPGGCFNTVCNRSNLPMTILTRTCAFRRKDALLSEGIPKPELLPGYPGTVEMQTAGPKHGSSGQYTKAAYDYLNSYLRKDALLSEGIPKPELLPGYPRAVETQTAGPKHGSYVLGELENVGVDVRVNDPTVTVSWVYTGNCTSPEFLMVVYKSGNTIVKSVSTHDSRNVLSELPLSSNIQVEMDPEGGVFTATWLPATTCDPVGYEVSVFDQSGTRIYLAEAESPPVQFDYLQECGTLSLKVKSVGTGWSNDDAEVQHFKLIPSPPKHILVEPIVSTSNAIVSWTFDHICGATEFTVNTYTAGNIVVGTYSTRDRSLVLTRLQGCVSLVLGIMATNDLGSTLETRSAPFSLRIPPGPPRYLLAEPNEQESSVDVSWEQGIGCATSVFRVKLIRQNGVVEANLETAEPRIKIRDIPKCTRLFVTVVGQNDKGTSAQRQSSPFAIPTVLAPPKNVQVETVTNTSSVSVSWEHEDVCPSPEFIITVFQKDRNVIYREYTSVRQLIISGLPACVPLQLGVATIGGSIDSQQTLSKSFYVLAAPNRPNALRVTTRENEPSVNITWENGGGCIATEYIVSARQSNGMVVASLNTSSFSATLTDIPVCTSLYVSVIGRNEFGSSTARNSIPFTIQTVPNEAQNIQINIITKISGVAVTWTYKDDCDLYEFFVSVYTQNGLMVKQVETYENSAEISGLPKCKPLTVGVVASNHLGRGPEKNSTVFNIPEGESSLFVYFHTLAKESSDSVMVIKLNATGNIRRFSSANSLDDAVARKSFLHSELSRSETVKITSGGQRDVTKAVKEQAFLSTE
ncbi:fibronectin type III domain-containing protein 7-like, partial [Clonorchis sinensis]